MTKKTLWKMFVAVVVCTAPSAARGQGPAAGNPGQGIPGLPPMNGGADGRVDGRPGVVPPPPVVPGLPDQDQRRDEHNPWINPHLLGHLIPHGAHSSGGPSAGRAPDPRGPKAVPSEAALRAVEYRFVPPPFPPAVGEGGLSVARGLSHAKGGGVWAAIGAAIAAACGGAFRRKKDF
jgi:hypothetical protein